MRGPGFRQKSDMRRQWRCPNCGAERRAAATVTVLRCNCVKPEPLMKLVEPIRTTRPTMQPLNKYVSEEDLIALHGPDPDPQTSGEVESASSVNLQNADVVDPMLDETDAASARLDPELLGDPVLHSDEEAATPQDDERDEIS